LIALHTGNQQWLGPIEAQAELPTSEDS